MIKDNKRGNLEEKRMEGNVAKKKLIKKRKKVSKEEA